METILLIDKFLQNAIVRWSSAVLVILLAIGFLIQTARINVFSLELKAEKGQNAKYAAKLTTQNDAIKKAGEDMQLMKLQAQAANLRADEIEKKLKQRKVEIREVILQGDCSDMVQQVINEARK